MTSKAAERPRIRAEGPTIAVAWATPVTPCERPPSPGGNGGGTGQPGDDDCDDCTEDLDLRDLLSRFDDHELRAYGGD